MDRIFLDAILLPLADNYENGNTAYWAMIEATAPGEVEQLAQLRATGLLKAAMPMSKNGPYQLTDKGYLQFRGRIEQLRAAGTHVTAGSMTWDGLLSNLERVVGDWRPRAYTRETQYSNALAEFIRDRAPKARVEREYRHFGTTVDVFVQWQGMFSKDSVFIEVKLNLSSKTAYDRLIGQIEQLEPKSNQVMIVLCGETNAALLDRLRTKYRDEREAFPNQTVSVMTKPLSKRVSIK